MATPKAYIDSCCLIEAIKAKRGLPLTHPASEADAVERLMRAANDGAIVLQTSTITIAEVVHLGDMPPPPDLKSYVERLILSGRNGIIAVAPSPQIVLLARDLAMDEGLREKAADRIHLATALHVGATEFLSVDGRLARKAGKSQVRGCSIVSPVQSTVLPDKYRAGLFGQ